MFEFIKRVAKFIFSVDVIGYHIIMKIFGFKISIKNMILSKRPQKTIEKLRQKISKKIKNGKKIVVYFVAYEKAQWIFQSIYDAMAKDDIFEPRVLCIKAWERENVEKNATEDLIKFFENKKLKIVREFDENNLPDIIFVAYHVFERIGLDIKLYEMYKKVLFCHIPYSWLVEREDRVDESSFNNYNIIYFWKQFVPDNRSYNAAMNNIVNGKNVVLSGYPKTDEILKAPGECSLWKNKDAKKIIWAPHWSLYNSPVAKANFDKYYIQMLDYVEKNPEIQMIIKPHPFLKGFIGNKKMQKEWNADIKITVEEYEEYLEKWKNLPNGNVHNSGDYFDLFKSSDAMILDSLSFMAEYSFLTKPMCFCSREKTLSDLKHDFNSMAKELLDGMHIAYQWNDIVSFIESVVINENNSKQEIQEINAQKHLMVNSGHVGEFIKDNIKSSLIN